MNEAKQQEETSKKQTAKQAKAIAREWACVCACVCALETARKRDSTTTRHVSFSGRASMRLFAFALFLTWLTVSHSTREELSAALQLAAGVFRDPAKVKKYGLERTVLVTGCNYGFVNHLFNFKCFLDRLDMKFLVISMDHTTHSYLQQNSSMISYPMATGAYGEVTTEPTEFRSPQFNLITSRKKEAVHTILQLGYDVLFSDTDVAILRDPFPYMLWKNVDYVHSLNDWCRIGDKFNLFRSKVEGNTGFYFVRSTNQTIKLWADAYAAAPKYPRLDDQAIFWKVLRSSKDPPIKPLDMCNEHNTRSVQTTAPNGERYLTTCYLDTCIFSSGMLSRKYVPELTYEALMENLDKLKETMCTVHANYISGRKKKMDRMREYGMWLANESAPGRWTCAPYVLVKPNKTESLVR